MIRGLRNFFVIILETLSETVDLAFILIMTAVTNVNIDELALGKDKVVYDLSKYDLLQLTKTFNLCNDNWQVVIAATDVPGLQGNSQSKLAC